MNKVKNALELALEALKNSVDLVSNEAREAESLYGKYLSRLARVQGLVALEVAHQTAIKACEEGMKEIERSEPTRHELQASGEHPAPCARFCEANAFRIAERGYQRQICELSKKLAEAKQEQGEPVAIIRGEA